MSEPTPTPDDTEQLEAVKCWFNRVTGMASSVRLPPLYEERMRFLLTLITTERAAREQAEKYAKELGIGYWATLISLTGAIEVLR